MIRLAIAEDHQSLIDGLELLLKYEEHIQIVGTVNDGEALVELVRLKELDVVITDMPKMDGIQATQIIKAEFPHVQVIAFSMFDQDEAVSKMVAAGASGYILKNTSLKNVLQAIVDVASGKRYFDANINTETIGAIKNTGKGKLTRRQKEILECIAQGKTSREIAEELFIGTHTVDTHRKNMARVLGLKGKGELLRYALDCKYRF
jgi:two-component system nitrate/nitrite response regulator NarL